MPDYPYTRTPNATGWDLGGPDFHDVVKAAVPAKVPKITCSGTSCVITYAEALTPTEKADLDGAVTNFSTLGRLKKRRYSEIDARTEQLIAEGFEYPASSGQMFSLSTVAQANLLGLKTMAEDPAFIYPVTWNFIDDSGMLTIPDAATALAFYMTAVGAVRSRRDSGTAIKDQIRAATTEAEVLAIVDPR